MDKGDKIIKQAIARMSEAIDGDRQNRKDARDDLHNLYVDSWPEEVRREREAAGRPVISNNRLPQFVRQVTGDIRKLNPAIKVLAADSAASTDTAEICEGLIRQIEASSSATSVYEGSAESAAQCGIGNFRVRTRYCDDNSFDQEAIIERIFNPFAVYWDPEAREPTRSDATYCFITDQMSAEKFKEKYPDAKSTDFEHDNNTDGLEHWHENGNVVIAEYFWKEETPRTIYLLADGSTTDKKPESFVKSRKVMRETVMWAKITGQEILEGPIAFPSKHIPVIATVGEEAHVGERVVRTSVIRFAKDAQRVYNYASSTQTEVVALQPKAPFIGTIKQFGYGAKAGSAEATLKTVWGKANNTTAAFLPYVPDEKAPGPPQRSQPPVASSGLAQEIMRAAEDMKATTGIYDAGLGQRSNESSGVAIRQRQMESDVSTSIYTDNLAKSIEQCGRVLVDMIPRIYDTNRIIRIVGDDDQETMVEINGVDQYDQMTGAMTPAIRMDAGKYDVRVTVGPNYSTRRQETQEGMNRFIQAVPQAGAVAADLFAKAQDWPDADKIAERLKRALPPEVIGPDEQEPEEQNQQLAQMQQVIEGLQQQLQMMAAEPGYRKAQAEATEAEAQAQEAGYDAMLKQLEVSAETGAINAAIQNAVQQALIASLQPGTLAR